MLKTKNFKHIDHGISIEQITRETTENGRFYFPPGGGKYPSVTTVLSIADKGDGLEKWKQRVGEQEAAKILRQAGIRGTAVHDLAEQYVKNDPNYSKGHMPANIFSFNQIKTVLDERVDNIYFQEEFLWSDFLRTAGQVDLIAEFDRKLSVIDFKTSRKKKEKKWIQNYFQQEAFYAVAFEERTKIPIKQLVTIITPDGDDVQVFVEDRDDHIKAFMKLRKQYMVEKGV